MAKRQVIVRESVAGDVPDMVRLIEQRRDEYERYQPVFWKKAADSAAKTAPYFAALVADAKVAALTASDGEMVVGFLIGLETPAPPVLDPGGMTGLIDDFCVSDPTRWLDVGGALLNAAKETGRRKGWRQIVVVCGHADKPKSAFLDSADLSLASTWWTTTV